MLDLSRRGSQGHPPGPSVVQTEKSQITHLEVYGITILDERFLGPVARCAQELVSEGAAVLSPRCKMGLCLDIKAAQDPKGLGNSEMSSG